MSTLLDDLIKARQEGTLAYEAFLQQTEDLIRRLAEGRGQAGVPAKLHGKREATVLYGHLADLPSDGKTLAGLDDDARADLALKLDDVVRQSAPADWRGDETRERQVLNAIFPLLSRDRAATKALFDLIKHQESY